MARFFMIVAEGTRVGVGQRTVGARFFALCEFVIRHYSHAARADWLEDPRWSPQGLRPMAVVPQSPNENRVADAGGASAPDGGHRHFGGSVLDSLTQSRQ